MEDSAALLSCTHRSLALDLGILVVGWSSEVELIKSLWIFLSHRFGELLLELLLKLSFVGMYLSVVIYSA